MKRLKSFAAWIGFLILLLPALPHNGEGQEPEHSIRASVRPNDSTKVDPLLPWVSEYLPPLIYAEWWREAEACSGRIVGVELTRAVKWVEINSKTFRMGVRPDDIFGFTDAEHLTIYMAEGSVGEREVVVHEMTHQLDYWYGVDEGEDYHPPDEFENCGLHTHHK